MRTLAATGHIGGDEWSMTLSLSAEEARAICEKWGVIPPVDGAVLRLSRRDGWEEIEIENHEGQPVLGRLRSLRVGLHARQEKK